MVMLLCKESIQCLKIQCLKSLSASLCICSFCTSLKFPFKQNFSGLNSLTKCNHNLDAILLFVFGGDPMVHIYVTDSVTRAMSTLESRSDNFCSV